MLGFVVAVLACTGTNCQMINPEPGKSFPTYEACQAELSAKRPALTKQLDENRRAGRSVQALCVREVGTVVDVEQPYDVIDTAMVHSEPSADSAFVGIVETGQRTLVTGIVAGTPWVRVVLPDGKSGYVYGNHLKSGGQPPPVEAAAPAMPPTNSPATQTQTVVPPAAAPRSKEPAKEVPAPSTTRSPQVAQAPAPAASPAPPKPTGAQSREFRDCPNCPTMISIPGGEFTMGSIRDPSERPIHRVRLRPFAIAKLELSVAEWNACVDGGGCGYKTPVQDPPPERRPITNLSWDDATQYVAWLAKTTARQYRLPTEAEWEYAARAGTLTRFPWGDEVQTGRAACQGCGPEHSHSRPADIGSFPPNGWGLLDMEGNVAQWVEDCWHSSYRGAPVNGDAWNSASCDTHVLRGGSWNNPPADVTVSSRNFYDGSVRYPGNGLRAALTIGPPTP